MHDLTALEVNLLTSERESHSDLALLEDQTSILPSLLKAAP